MLKILGIVKGLLFLMLMTGCAGLPEFHVSYYLPKTSMNATVNQLISCTPGQTAADGTTTGRKLMFAYAVTPAISHQADTSARNTIDLKELEKAHSNAEIGLEFYADGRLKSISAKSVGQGKAIMESAIAVANTVWPLHGGGTSSNEDKACDYIKKATGKDNGTGVLAIAYTLDKAISVTHATGTIPALEPSESTTEHYTTLTSLNVLPKIELKAVRKDGSLSSSAGELTQDFPSGITAGDDRNTSVCGDVSGDRLVLRETALVRVALSVDGSASPSWQGSAIAATDTCFSVPLMDTALFGSRYLKISLDGNGMVTALDLESSQGLSDGLGTLGSSITAISPTDSAEAQALKAESDLIYQQQRLLRCQADPASCTP